MKKYIVYECEKCGMKSQTYNEIWECEASHLGLTSKEMVKYTDLKETVRYWSSVVSSTNNNDTRGKLDRAIEKLIVFEEKYDIKS